MKIKAATHQILIEETKKKIKTHKKLYEGLICSYDIKTVLNGLKKRNFKNGDVKVEKTFTGYTVLIKLTIETEYKNKINELNKFIENICGWKLSAILNSNGKVFKKEDDLLDFSDDFVWLQYEPKFDIETNYIDFPNFLYHICPKKNLDKIKKIGLTPRTKSKIFNYDERIYVCNNIEDLLELSKMFVKTKDKTSVTDESNFTFYILQLNIKSILFPIRIFKDPNFKNGYYTLENVQPQYIKPIVKIELDNNGNIVKKTNI
jgi:hypothetical protein